jgi:hypothetical protein
VLSYRQAKPATNALTYFPNIVVIQGDQVTNCSAYKVVELVADIKDLDALHRALYSPWGEACFSVRSQRPVDEKRHRKTEESYSKMRAMIAEFLDMRRKSLNTSETN